jgi:DNA polymerase I-like protein with 3'-5' exonuclease and polymerase domains
MNITIPVYSEQALSPRAVDVIRSIVNDAYPDHTIKFVEHAYGYTEKVLVFGKAPVGTNTGAEFVYTYSIAQIMTKANAASVLTAAIRQFVEEPDPIPFRQPLVTYSPSDILRSLDPLKPTAIDIETDGNLDKENTVEEVNPISIAFYQPGHAPIVLVYGWGREEPERMHPIPNANDGYWLPQVQALLTAFKYPIYHNGKFDTRVLNRYFGLNLDVWFDTMLAHHTLNIAAGEHKLKPLARRYLGAPDWEGELSKYTKAGGHYEFIPQAKLVEYNGWDVYWTYKLYEFLAPQITADEEAQKAFLFEMEAAKFLLDVEAYGIPLNVQYARDYAEELTAEIKRKATVLCNIVGTTTYNPNSPQQVKGAFHRLGMPVTGTDAKKILLPYKEEHWDEMSEVQREFMTTHLEFKELDKRRGTYAVGWLNASRGGRVHPTFLVHGTSTGRLSSTRPNAQNVPRDKTVRKLVRTHG